MSGVTIEIFTDGASRNNNKKTLPSEASGAAIFVVNQLPRRYMGKYFYDTTNNFGEIHGILIGLRETVSVLRRTPWKPPYVVDLYSDSGFCIQGLNDWYHSWVKCLDDEGFWLNSSGNRVAHQETFKLIKEIENYDDLDIKFKHVKGHLDMQYDESDPKFDEKEAAVEKALNTFERMNGYRIGRDRLRYLTYMNHLVDELANQIVDSKQGCDRTLELRNDKGALGVEKDKFTLLKENGWRKLNERTE